MRSFLLIAACMLSLLGCKRSESNAADRFQVIGRLEAGVYVHTHVKDAQTGKEYLLLDRGGYIELVPSK